MGSARLHVGLDAAPDRSERAAGRLLAAREESAQTRLDARLGVAHEPVHELSELLAQRHGVVEAEAAAAQQARDEPFGLAAGAPGGLLGLGPLAPAARGGGDADEPRQHLARKAARSLPDALEQRLGQRQVGEVLAALLVEHDDLLAARHEVGELAERDVAAGGRVVELAVAGALDGARPVARVHAGSITQCVRNARLLTRRARGGRQLRVSRWSETASSGLRLLRRRERTSAAPISRPRASARTSRTPARRNEPSTTAVRSKT